jgi:uncharacterized protein YwqG
VTDGELIEQALAGPLEPVADLVRQLVAPSWRLAPTDEPRRSRIGGTADLPPDLAWPTTNDGRPLDVLATLDLDELPDRGPLPAGRLVFFYDTEGQPWGFEPSDGDGHAVLHVPPGVATEQRGTPGPYAPRAVTFVPELTVPSEAPDWFPEEREDAYFDLQQALLERHAGAEDRPIHRIGGHPDAIQADAMQLEAQLVTNGVTWGDDDPREAALAPGAVDWRLLLQLESELAPQEVLWGDAGRIYFWARESDLRAGRFDATWLILQCG